MSDVLDTIHAVSADFDTIFSWDYERSRGSLVKLYEKAKTSQWNVSTDLDWSIDVDPEKIGQELGGGGIARFQALQDAEGSPVKHFGEKEWRQVSVEIQNSLLSQFMHGEQGALLCTARIVETVPWIDAKYYAATQVMDEARHVEVFARYLDEKLGSQYGINDNLKGILDDILADPRWDIAYLGMQIMVEGLALAAFGLLHQLTTEPLLKKLLRYVMSDEARHVAFGVLSLQEFYAGLTDAEMRERQEFAFDVAKRLQRRFAHTEMWAKMGVDPDAVYRTMDQVNPPAQRMFQQLLFAKIVPNCKKLGLIDASGGWLRGRFTEIGVIEFENLVDTGEEYAELDEVARDREAAVAEVVVVDREALGEAADRGLLPAFWARRQPDRVAIYSEVGNRTFAEVASDANRLVRALRARGVRAGDGLALLCSNRPEFAETVVAVREAGLRLTTVNWHLTADEAGYIVDDCDATAFVADARFAHVAAGAAELAPSLKARIAIGGDIPGFDAWDDVLAAHDGTAIDDPQAGGLMLYTSGTTGRPKGVRKEKGDPRADLDVGLLTAYDPDAHVHLLTGPLYHAAPLAFSWSAPAALGVPIVMMDGWSAEETLRLIERHRVTHTHLVPTMFHRLLSLPDAVKERYDLSSLLFIIHGAAPCPVEVKQRLMDWLGPIVWEYYVATEGSGTLVSPAAWLRRPGTVGKVVPADHVRILDANGADAAPGEAGTVYLKAPAASEAGRFEYYKAPEKTEGAYVGAGDYFTLGDVGYVDADGYLFLTDRSAHLIISGGVNIYPAEVEAVLIGHPAVGDVGVVGVPDDDWGEIVVAVVEPQPGVAPTVELAAELVEWCRDRIADYKCPRRVEFTEALPRHDNGKLYKHQLREQLRTH